MIVALYARVSTTKQVEKDLSIPDQIRQMKEWCKARHYGVAVEYVEAGASATDDRRPVFQEMIAEACVTPAPFDAIIIHSLSRFFRDSIEFGIYERRLKKHGVVVISITQETSDDPCGEMARRIFSVFDEYQSKENAKHTLRALKENARRGYHNGSAPPLGYRAVEVSEKGNKGKKKRLEVDQAEAGIVRKIFDLYVNGYKGKSLGMSGIEKVLNDSGSTMRGREWKRNVINKILENRVYRGEYIFNRREGKTRSVKPESEWIVVPVEPIVDEETFAVAKRLRFERSPVNVPPRIVNSPTLLTGLLKCGGCGAPMTLATGKGGRYRYYECRTRITKGKGVCRSGNIAVEKLDSLVLDALSRRVFTPARVSSMLKSLGSDLRKSKETHNERIRELSKELDDLKQGTDRLYEAVERGLLPLDSCLHDRVRQHQARRQEILIEMAGVRRQQEFPLSKMGKEYVQAFCSVLSAKLKQKESNFGKEYLRLLVDEIRVDGREVYLKGSYGTLAAVVQKTKLGRSFGVPSFGNVWLPVHVYLLVAERPHNNGYFRLDNFTFILFYQCVGQLCRRQASSHNLVGKLQRDAAVGPDGNRFVKLRIVEELYVHCIADLDFVLFFEDICLALGIADNGRLPHNRSAGADKTPNHENAYQCNTIEVTQHFTSLLKLSDCATRRASEQAGKLV